MKASVRAEGRREVLADRCNAVACGLPLNDEIEYRENELIDHRLEICIARRSWKRDHVADVTDAGYELHGPLKPQSKTGVRYGSVSP